MLYLVFELDHDRYALETSNIVEVLPLVAVRRLPAAPHGVSGVFDYRGEPVLLVDLCALLLGRPAAARLTTRIVVVRLPDGETSPLVGLIAEGVCETIRPDERDDAPDDAGHFAVRGTIARDHRGPIGRIGLDDLVPASLRTQLRFPATC